MVPIQVGMLEASPLLPVSAAVKRAMQLTRDALEQCGYKIVDVAWPDKIWKKQRDLYFTMIANDANPKILEDIANSYEKFVPCVEQSAFFHRVWPWQNTGRDAITSEHLRRLTPFEFEKAVDELAEFKAEFAELWNDLGVEVVVSPLFPHCAPLNSHNA